MTKLKHDRVPDKTLSDASVPAGPGKASEGIGPVSNGPLPRGILLSLRLRTQDSSGTPLDVSMESDSIASALIRDVITASGGASLPAQGHVLSASFANMQMAVLTARRVRWGLEGLNANAGYRDAAAAILVYAVEDLPPERVAAVLQNAAPGQVLLSGPVSEAVQQLPSVSLRPISGGWSELQWRSPEPAPSASADEQALGKLILDLGREDPGAAKAEVVPEARMLSVRAETAPVATEAEVETPSGMAALLSGNRKWLLVGGVAAAVLLAAALIVPGMVSGKHDTPAVPAAGPAANPVSGPASTTSVPANPAKPPATPGSQAGNDNPKPQKSLLPLLGKPKPSKTDVPAQKPAQGGSCDLTEAEIPRSLSRAESLMYAGKLSDAQAVYERLVGCPSAREKAQEGLQRVKQRIAAGSSSGPSEP